MNEEMMELSFFVFKAMGFIGSGFSAINIGDEIIEINNQVVVSIGFLSSEILYGPKREDIFGNYKILSHSSKYTPVVPSFESSFVLIKVR